MRVPRSALWWCVFASACATATHVVPDGKVVEEMAIREAVFRFQFEASTSQMGPAPVCFLQFADEQDPPMDFLARFTDCGVKVAPASMAVVPQPVTNHIDAVRHKQDGGRGRIFSVDRVRWITDDVVEVSGGYYQGPRSSSDHTYRVERRQGSWVVTNDEMGWIS